MKRGVFNVLGEVSKICCGTINCDDAHCYNQHIKYFEKNSGSMTYLSKQQLYVVKVYSWPKTALFLIWREMKL